MRWSDLWLPPDFSHHGPAIDHLFAIIAILTGVVLVAVHGMIVYCMIRFRHREGKAKYTHGSGLLEVVWTAIPVAILLSLAIYSNRIWENYRNPADLNDPAAAHIQILASQFKWSPSYGKKAGTEGLIFLPVDRTSVLEITSKDVIHDFFVPELRINAYAVPGETVRVAIRPTVTSKSLQQEETFDVATLESRVEQDQRLLNLVVDVDANAPGTNKEFKSRPTALSDGWRYFRLVDGKQQTIIYDGHGLAGLDETARRTLVQNLLAGGITRVRGHVPAYIEVICAQLCGDLHATMEGKIIVLDDAEWEKRFGQ